MNAAPLEIMVGARGFEPPTPCSQNRCATRLRYAPDKKEGYLLSFYSFFCKYLFNFMSAFAR